MVPNPAVQFQGQGVVSADQANTWIQSCASVAQMRTISGIGQMNMWLQGYTAANDGGQGMFVWVPNATGPDDGGITTVVPTGGTAGAWARQISPTLVPTGSARAFRASVRNPPPHPWATTPVVVVPYDNIDFDTTGGGFSLTQVIPGWGTYPGFKVTVPGLWRFDSATQFHDNSPPNNFSMLKAFSHVTSSGATVEYYQFNSPYIPTLTSPSQSATWSVGGSYLCYCAVGDFIWVNDDLESASSSSSLVFNYDLATLVCTYFTGTFVGT